MTDQITSSLCIFARGKEECVEEDEESVKRPLKFLIYSAAQSGAIIHHQPATSASSRTIHSSTPSSTPYRQRKSQTMSYLCSVRPLGKLSLSSSTSTQWIPTLTRHFHVSSRAQDFHFDTHHFVQRLEREGLNRAQAEGIMSAMAEVIDESIRNMTSNMVTKADQEKVSIYVWVNTLH